MDQDRFSVEETNEAKQSISKKEEKVLIGAGSGGAALGGIGGAGAAVLAILGLAGTLPFHMMTISTIVLGAGLFTEGALLGVTAAKVDADTRVDETAPTAGFSLQAIAGAGAIVLGILSLLGLMPQTLVPVALLAMGGAFAFGGPTSAELNLGALEVRGAPARTRRSAAQAAQASGGLMLLVGLGAITLGILSILGVPSAGTLNLVALLTLGVALFLEDSVVLGRFGHIASH